MAISFTGIKNLSVTSSNHQQIGSYYTPTGELGSGMKDVTYVDISYNVTDDEKGNDHDKYIEALSRANKFYLLNKYDPTKVQIQMKLAEIDNDVIKFSNVSFKLNNNPIALNNDNDLKLYQYLADMTREHLKNSDKATDYDKKMLDITNEGINMVAMDYFECEPVK